MPSPQPHGIEIVEIDRTAIAIEPWRWHFAVERRDDIDRHFAALRQRRTGVWNGRVLLMQHYTIRDRVLQGACFETDYASMCAWRDWNFPDAAVSNVFAGAAIRTADGAWLLGEMAANTAAAGLVYFPCGTPEPADIDADGRLDLTDNLKRELKEETGLAFDELDAAPGWSVVIDRCYIALVKRFTTRQSADELQSRIARYLADERHPEFSRIRFVRAPGELTASMPNFVIAFLEREWRQ